MDTVTNASPLFYVVFYIALYAAGVVSGILWYRRKGDAEVARLVAGWKAERNVLRNRVDDYAERITGKADSTLERLDEEFNKFVQKFDK